MHEMRVLQLAACVLIVPGLAVSQESDLNGRDSLRLVSKKSGAAEYRVSVDVLNDQELAGIDIPLRFGDKTDAVHLDRVEWSDRVLNWDFKHAAIDSAKKTVILGLIAELGGSHPDPYLPPYIVGDPSIATLVFKVEGDHRPKLTTFTTAEPHHSLTFLYNTLEDSVFTVKEFTPVFEARVSEE